MSLKVISFYFLLVIVICKMYLPKPFINNKYSHLANTGGPLQASPPRLYSLAFQNLYTHTHTLTSIASGSGS